MRLAREWATAIHLTSWWTPQAHFFDKRTGERIGAKRPAASVSG